MMILFSLCTSSTGLRTLLIIKILLQVICTLIPLIIIYRAFSVSMKNAVDGGNEVKKDFSILFRSLVAGLIIFLIPTIINYSFNNLLKNNNDFVTCINNASLKGVLAAEAKEKQEAEEKKKQEEEEAQKISKEMQEKRKKEIEEAAKKREEQEKKNQKNNENNENNNNGNNNGGNNNSSANKQIETSYGVYLGLDHEDGIDKLMNYKLVVIDLQEFSKSDVDKLHAKGIKVYSYLNVGSVENYRSYYKRFKSLYLGTYENWEDEKWVDVSNKSFQNFIINELEPSLRNKGADGYFIDNCDVYANFKKDKIYNGLKTILSSIHSHNLPMLINGGDEFVSKAISDGSYSQLFDGVNQEEVFTLINFDNHTYKNQHDSEKKYYQDYLQKVKSKGLMVYLLEYGASSEKEREIADYCSKNGFSYFNAKSYNLDK